MMETAAGNRATSSSTLVVGSMVRPIPLLPPAVDDLCQVLTGPVGDEGAVALLLKTGAELIPQPECRLDSRLPR